MAEVMQMDADEGRSRLKGVLLKKRRRFKVAPRLIKSKSLPDPLLS